MEATGEGLSTNGTTKLSRIRELAAQIPLLSWLLGALVAAWTLLPLVGFARSAWLLGAVVVLLGRPGARRESLERYIKRMEELESIAKEFKGVEQAFAIQAGRELRIIVEEDQLNDDRSRMLAADVARGATGCLEK